MVRKNLTALVEAMIGEMHTKTGDEWLAHLKKQSGATDEECAEAMIQAILDHTELDAESIVNLLSAHIEARRQIN